MPELELEYGIDKSKEDSIRAKLLGALRESYQERVQEDDLIRHFYDDAAPGLAPGEVGSKSATGIPSSGFQSLIQLLKSEPLIGALIVDLSGQTVSVTGQILVSQRYEKSSKAPPLIRRKRCNL